PMQLFPGRDAFTALLNRMRPGAEIKLELDRKETKKTETIKVTLGSLTDFVPDALPEPATLKKALQRPTLIPPEPPQGKADTPGQPKDKDRMPPKEKPEQAPEITDTKEPSAGPEKKPTKVAVGLVKRNTATRENEYWLYIPENYDPNISHALVVW